MKDSKYEIVESIYGNWIRRPNGTGMDGVSKHTVDELNYLLAEIEHLKEIVMTITKGKLPCNPDHNGECLVCDCWLSDCPFLNKENNS